ncbi:UNVERIFIED_CONTAM: hypothetical protein K2H54_012490 [Gekko kuhli]
MSRTINPTAETMNRENPAAGAQFEGNGSNPAAETTSSPPGNDVSHIELDLRPLSEYQRREGKEEKLMRGGEVTGLELWMCPSVATESHVKDSTEEETKEAVDASTPTEREPSEERNGGFEAAWDSERRIPPRASEQEAMVASLSPTTEPMALQEAPEKEGIEEEKIPAPRLASERQPVVPQLPEEEEPGVPDKEQKAMPSPPEKKPSVPQLLPEHEEEVFQLPPETEPSLHWLSLEMEPSLHSLPPETEPSVPQPPPQKEQKVPESPQEKEPSVPQPPPQKEQKVSESPQETEPSVPQPPPQKEQKVPESPQETEPSVPQPPPQKEQKVPESPQEMEPSVPQSPPQKEQKVPESPQETEPSVPQPPPQKEQKVPESPQETEPSVPQPPPQKEQKVPESPQETEPSVPQPLPESGQNVPQLPGEMEPSVTHPLPPLQEPTSPQLILQSLPEKSETIKEHVALQSTSPYRSERPAFREEKEATIQSEPKAGPGREDDFTYVLARSEPRPAAAPPGGIGASLNDTVEDFASHLREVGHASKSAMASSISSFVASPIGQVFAHTIDRALEKSEEWLDYYLPVLETDVESSTAAEEEHGTTSEDLCKEGCFVRINSLSTKLRNRAFLLALHQLKTTRQAVKETLPMLDQMLDVQLELKALDLTRSLAQQLYGTYHNLLPHVANLPIHLQEKAIRVHENMEELQSHFTSSPSLRDLPSSLVVQSRQKMAAARENLDEILDFLAQRPAANRLPQPASSPKGRQSPSASAERQPTARSPERKTRDESSASRQPPSLPHL